MCTYRPYCRGLWTGPIHHSTWCTEHPYPTHSLSESVDMLVCLGSHYLYTCAHCSLSVCILCMTSTMLRPLASYTHTTVPVACVHTSTLILLHVFAPLPFCVCVPHIPIHIPMYVHLCTIQYTLRTTTYCTTVLVLCHLLHIYMCAPKYTYSIHSNTSITCHCMSSSHSPLHM